jgi:hypothetical protein
VHGILPDREEEEEEEEEEASARTRPVNPQVPLVSRVIQYLL